MDKPNWNDAPSWAQYLAQNENGRWFWYDIRPSASLFRGQWIDNGYKMTSADSYPVDWRTTLEQRPAT